MADALRPRLDHLQELAKQVNAATDDAGRIVQGVETYLSDVLHLGARAAIPIDIQSYPDEYSRDEKYLVYDRYGPKFRIFVTHYVEIEGHEEINNTTLWANCTRDVKLLAFNRLPMLLDKLIESLTGTLDLVKTSSDTLETLLPPVKEKGAKS